MLSAMIRATVIAALCFVADAKKVVSVAQAAKTRQQFLKAMKAPAPALRKGDAARKKRAYNKILSKAKPVGRRLEDAENEWEPFGFDPSQYSLKYTGCSTIATYSDEMAEQEEVDTVLENKKFAVFRLCPTNYCNKYSVNGCSYDYGEYLVLLEDYLEAVGEYFEQKQEDFCEYCRPCMEADEADDDGNGDDGNNDGEQCDEDVCADYSMCVEEEKGDDDQAVEEMEMREFFECRGVDYGDDDGNDQQYYIGPRCDSDGYTISIDVFSDETCSTYTSDLSVYDLTGFEIDSDEIANYFPRDCISCLEQVSGASVPLDVMSVLCFTQPFVMTNVYSKKTGKRKSKEMTTLPRRRRRKSVS